MPTIEELAEEVASLRRRVEASEAVLEIQSLKARYGELVDAMYRELVTRHHVKLREAS